MCHGCPPLRRDNLRALGNGILTVQAGKPCSMMLYLPCSMTLDVYRGRKTTIQQQNPCSTIPIVDLARHGVFRLFVVLLFYVHGKHLRSCRDGQLT